MMHHRYRAGNRQKKKRKIRKKHLSFIGDSHQRIRKRSQKKKIYKNEKNGLTVRGLEHVFKKVTKDTEMPIMKTNKNEKMLARR